MNSRPDVIDDFPGVDSFGFVEVSARESTVNTIIESKDIGYSSQVVGRKAR